MKIQPGNRVYWIDPCSNHRHKCEVTRVYTKKAKIVTDDMRSLSVAIDDIELVPLPWKSVKEIEVQGALDFNPDRFLGARVRRGSREGTVLEVHSKYSIRVLFDDGLRECCMEDWLEVIELESDRPVGSIVRDGDIQTIELESDRSVGSIVSDGDIQTIELDGDRPLGSIVRDGDVQTIELDGDRPLGSIVSDGDVQTIELESDRPVGSIVGNGHHETIEPESDRSVGSIVRDGDIQTIELESDRPNGSIVEIEKTIERLSLGELFQLQIFISKLIPMKRRIPREPPRGSVNRYECKKTPYWRYTYSIDGRTKHRHIAGGCVGSPPADDRAAMVRQMIADGKPPEAIVAWLDKGDRPVAFKGNPPAETLQTLAKTRKTW